MRSLHLKLLVFIFSLFTLSAQSQFLDSLSLDTITGSKSIKEAMQHPDDVIKLVLEKNKLKEVPEEIKQFTNLQYLDLSKNKIKTIPSWIGQLSSLQVLVLSKTNIDTLPPEIGKLTHLKYLIMNRSELRALPPEIGKLKELKAMDLWDDNLSYFPSELKNISGNLESLDLRDVLVNDQQHALLKAWLPSTTIYLSPICPCEK
jgi:Leucine-rich repeat (LRR) protein